MMSAETQYNLDKLRELIVAEVLKEHMKIYPNYVQDQVF
jgi:hypothetical protein